MPQVHNEYYQWVAETGVLGGLALLVLLIFFFREVWRRRDVSGDHLNTVVRSASLGGIGILLIHSFVSFPLQLPANRLVGLLFLGVLMAPGCEVAGASPERTGKAALRGHSKTVVFGSALLVVVACCSVAGPFVADWLCSCALERTGEKRLELCQRALKWAPENYECWYFYGLFLYQEEQYQRAARALEEAAKLEDRLATHEILFDLYMRIGLGGKVLEQARAIADLNPCYPPNQVRLGDSYALMGQYQRAWEAYNKAVELDGAFSDGLDSKIKKMEEKAAEKVGPEH